MVRGEIQAYYDGQSRNGGEGGPEQEGAMAGGHGCQSGALFAQLGSWAKDLAELKDAGEGAKSFVDEQLRRSAYNFVPSGFWTAVT